MDSEVAVQRELVEQYKSLAAAQSILPKLEGTIRHSEHFTTVYSIRSRVKNAARLTDKIREKRVEGRPAYCLTDVSDIIGIRFISLYRQDMASAIMHALELVTGDTDVSPNGFKGASLHEFKSYTSNSIAEQDLVNIDLRNYYEPEIERRTGVTLDLVPRSRYSSVHVVLKIPVRHGEDDFLIPIELQFRSVFEDAWAEIDHKLLYELGRFGKKPDETRREAIAQHMTILKKMVDTAADYADVIRRTVIDPAQRPTSIPRNLDHADYIKTLAARAGLDDGLTAKLEEALAEKGAIDVQIERGSAETSKERYLDVVKKLGLLQPLIEGAPRRKDAEAMRAIDFSIRMEIALCRMLSEHDGQLRLAVDGYQQIVRDFPAYPGGWFRSGQARQRLSALTDVRTDAARDLAGQAFEHFGKAIETLEACAELPKAQRLVAISPDQQRYISDNARRLQCFAKWRLVDRRRQAGCELDERDLNDVIVAFQLNQQALALETETKLHLGLANNSAYYAADAIEIAGKLGVCPPDLPGPDDLRPLLETMERDGGEDMDVLLLNTMIHAYLVTNQPEKAAEMARKILDLNADEGNLRGRKPPTAYTLEAVDRSIKFAWKVIRQGSALGRKDSN